MKEEHQIECFANDLDRLVDRYCDEFNLSYAAVVGVMHLKTHLLMLDWKSNYSNEEEKPHG